MAWSSYVLYTLCQQETNFSRESIPGECRHDKDGYLNFYPNCAGKELRQALLPFIANAMSCLPSEQDKPEVIYLLKKAGIVFALKDNKVALNLKAIEDVSETPQVQQHKKHYRTYCYTNTETNSAKPKPPPTTVSMVMMEDPLLAFNNYMKSALLSFP